MERITDLLKTKTFWAAIAASATAIGCYVSGACDLGSTIATVSTSIIGIFVRHGLIKIDV